MSDRPTPETKEAWDAVSRLPSGMYDSRVSIWAYATAMSDHSRKMERQRDELLEIANRAVSELEGNLRCEETCKCSGRHQIAELQAAIAAVKGVAP